MRSCLQARGFKLVCVCVFGGRAHMHARVCSILFFARLKTMYQKQLGQWTTNKALSWSEPLPCKWVPPQITWSVCTCLTLKNVLLFPGKTLESNCFSGAFFSLLSLSALPRNVIIDCKYEMWLTHDLWVSELAQQVIWKTVNCNNQ